MEHKELVALAVEKKVLESQYLNRKVTIDIYLPLHMKDSASFNLLLLNDGQDLPKMPFEALVDDLFQRGSIQPLVCVGIHASEDRRMEYGTANVLDFMQRGAKAAAHQQFVLNELLPFIKESTAIPYFKEIGYAGFSLGGLSAIDTVWNFPQVFSVAGVFSGSLWWRSKDLDQGYNEDTDRIMHQLIRTGRYFSGLRFYFTTGSQDETADRNNNGIIDSIDDTLGLMEELKKKGYTSNDIQYINYEDGRHDVETRGRALPAFLEWVWGSQGRDRNAIESC